MAGESGGVHPGSWLGDGVEEFKKLPMWGKIAVGVLLVAVVGFAIYKYRQNQAASANSAAQSALSGAGSSLPPGVAGGAGGGSQSPFPSVNGLPVLPSGIGPIFDPNGNLIGYGPTPTNPTPTPTPPGPTGGGPTPGPTPTIGPVAGQPGIPLIPNGMYNGPSYSNLPANTYFSWAGVRYLLSTGGGNRLYGQVNGQGNKILLYGDSSAYNQAAPPAPTATPLSTAASMSNPNQYLQAATPHISAAHQ